MLYHDRGQPELYKLAERIINSHNLEYLCGIWGLLRIDNVEMAVAAALREYDDFSTLLDQDTRDLARTLRIAFRPDLDLDASGRAYRNAWWLRDVYDGRLMIDILPGPRHPGMVFAIPLFHTLSKCENFPEGSYVVYMHQFPEQPGQTYCGITRQGWVPRWKQHLSAANNGSPYLFHKAIRTNFSKCDQYHEILGAGLEYEAAMALEETVVAKYSLFPRGLNMIPGGFAGIKWLGQHGVHNITPRDYEQRQKLLKHFSTHCGRKGIPNPLTAARWSDGDFSASVICGNPRNFNLEDVREMRYLASLGYDHDWLANRFSCRIERVRQLLEWEDLFQNHLKDLARNRIRVF